MNKLVSIIVPVYNVENIINNCLNNLLNQTYSNIEIILVDDGSKDDSLIMCKKRAKEDKRVKVYSKKNGGPSSARNLGLKKAKGDYLIFVDSDDYLHQNAIELMVNSIKDNDVLICNYNYLIGDNIKANKNFVMDKFDFIEFVTFNDCWEPWGKLFKTEVIKKKFNEKYYIAEDLLFWFENSKNIKKYNFINIPIYDYYINPNSLMHGNNNLEKLFSSLDLFDCILQESNSKIVKDKIKYMYFCTVYNLLNKSLDDIYLKKFKNYLKDILTSNYISIKFKVKSIAKFIILKVKR